jgi:hypothetical protein
MPCPFSGGSSSKVNKGPIALFSISITLILQIS